MKEYYSYTIDLSLNEGAVLNLEPLSNDQDLFKEIQAKALKDALEGYAQQSERQEGASELDASRYGSIEIIEHDGKKKTIQNLAKNALEEYNKKHSDDKKDKANFSMIIDYLKEKEEITITESQAKFLAEKFNQTGYPSLMAQMSVSGAEGVSLNGGGGEKRILRLNADKTLAAFDYEQTFKGVDTQKSDGNKTAYTGKEGTFSVRADFKEKDKPKVSLSYNSQNNSLAMGLDREVMKALGDKAITNKKNKYRFKRFKSTIKNALRGNKKEERSSSVSSDSPSPQKNRPLLDFMKRQVGRITSAVVSNRSRSNESDRGL
jgi:hypothetical protein